MAIKASKVEVEFPAATTLVSVDDVKEHLSIYSTDFDTMLGQMVVAATVHAGNYIGQSLDQEDIKEYFTRWDKYLTLSRTDVTGTPTVEYYDRDNTLVSFAGTVTLDPTSDTGALIVDGYNTGTLSQDIRHPIVVSYSSLHPVAGDNQAIRRAIMIMTADLFKERETNTDGITHRAQITAERLLYPYKRFRI